MAERYYPAVMERPLGGTHVILNAESAALLRRLAAAEERSLNAVVRRALKQYAAVVGVPQ